MQHLKITLIAGSPHGLSGFGGTLAGIIAERLRRAGTALALFPLANPVHKVTIKSRGRSLGATSQIPEEDRYNLSRSYVENRIAVMLRGRTAERLVFEESTTGASNDLSSVTHLARMMVCQWGMSEKIGPVAVRHGEQHPFLGQEMTDPKEYSEHTASIIDEEIQAVVQRME